MAHALSALDRVMAAVNQHDPDLIEATIDEVCAPDMVISTPLPLDVTGAEAQKLVFRILLSAMPDLHIEVQDRIAEGDKVVYRNVVTGTHQGTYMGVEPTGKRITYNEIFIVRLDAAGRVAQTWGVVDVAAQMRQLGLIQEVRH